MEVLEVGTSKLKDKNLKEIFQKMLYCNDEIYLDRPSSKALTFLNKMCDFTPKGFLEFYQCVDGALIGNLEFFSTSMLEKERDVTHFSKYNTSEIKRKYLKPCGLILEGNEDIYFFAKTDKMLIGFLNTVKNENIFCLNLVNLTVTVFDDFYTFFNQILEDVIEEMEEDSVIYAGEIEEEDGPKYILTYADPDNDDGLIDIGEIYDPDNDDGYYDLDESWFE